MKDSVRVSRFWLLAVLLLTQIVIMGAINYSGSTPTHRQYEKKYGSIVASDLLVNGVTAVYSDIFPMGSYKTGGIWFRATSASGTPVVSATIEFSPTQDAANFSEIEGGSGTLSVNDELPHNDFIVVKQSTWGRIRVNGVGANPADTLVDIVINLAR